MFSKVFQRLKQQKERKMKFKKNKEKEPIFKELSDKLITSVYKDEYIKELFRSLRTKILLGLYEFNDKSIVITSLDTNTGKSTIAANIAISIAQQHKKTVLIDGDLRRGVLYNAFGIKCSPGLSEFLYADRDITDNAIESLCHETKVPNLFLIPSGEHVSLSSELLTSERFLILKSILSKKFEIVILDTAPLGAVSDAVVVNEIFSRYIIIVRAGLTNVVDLKKKMKEYPILEKKILGFVLNFAAVDKIRSYYKRSKYY